MKSILFSLPLLVFCLTGAASRAQSPFFGARLHRGFIIPHSKDIAGVSDSHPFGLEFNLQWLARPPRTGLSPGIAAKRGLLFQYFNFDRPEVLGEAFAVTPYVEPLIFPEKRVFGSFHLGLGLVYLNRVYDPQTNPSNLFFSSPISMLALAGAQAQVKINPHWHAALGFHYNHISNGGMKNPNKGINFPTFSAGATYSLRPMSLRRACEGFDWRSLPPYYYYVQAVVSVKTEDAASGIRVDSPRWLLGGALVGARRVGRLSALAAGTEWVHDGWTRAVLDASGSRKSAFKGGILVGHDLSAGHFRFTTHLGIYLYRPFRRGDDVYQRYGLSYSFGPSLQLGATLKAHRHVAELFDLRVGWQWQ